MTGKKNPKDLLGKLLSDGSKNIKEINFDSYSQEIKKRTPGFSEEIKVDEEIKKIDVDETPKIEKEIEQEVSSITEKELDEFRKIINDKINQLDEKLIEVKTLVKELKNSQTEIRDIKSDVESLKSYFREKLADQEKMMYDFKREIRKEFDRETHELADDVNMLKVTVNSLKTDVRSHESQIKAMKEEITTIQASLKDLTDAVIKSVNEMKKVKTHLYDAIDSLTKEIKKIKVDVETFNRIKTSLSRFREELTKLETALKEIEESTHPELIFEQTISLGEEQKETDDKKNINTEEKK